MECTTARPFFMRVVNAAGPLIARLGLLGLIGLLGVTGCGNDDPQPAPEITIRGGNDPGPDPGPDSAAGATAKPIAASAEQTLEAIGANLTRDTNGTVRSISCYRNRQLKDSHVARIATFE